MVLIYKCIHFLYMTCPTLADGTSRIASQALIQGIALFFRYSALAACLGKTHLVSSVTCAGSGTTQPALEFRNPISKDRALPTMYVKDAKARRLILILLS